MATRSPDTKEIERRMLGALCTDTLSLDDRSETLRILAGYSWILPDHRVIYEALRRSRQPNSDALREHIIAEITRLGFPDIDVAPYFVPSALSKPDLEKLVDTLRAADPEDPGTR
jgi:hypothetical protein